MSHKPSKAGGQQSLKNYYEVLSETDDNETPQSPQVGAHPVHTSSSSESIARYPNFCNQVFDEHQVNSSISANSAEMLQSTARHQTSPTPHPTCSDSFSIVHRVANMRREHQLSADSPYKMSPQDLSRSKSSTASRGQTSSSHRSLAGPASADPPTQCMNELGLSKRGKTQSKTPTPTQIAANPITNWTQPIAICHKPNPITLSQSSFFIPRTRIFSRPAPQAWIFPTQRMTPLCTPSTPTGPLSSPTDQPWPHHLQLFPTPIKTYGRHQSSPWSLPAQRYRQIFDSPSSKRRALPLHQENVSTSPIELPKSCVSADHPTATPTNSLEPQPDPTDGCISSENKYDLPMQVASEQAELLQQKFYHCVYYREIEEDPEQDDPSLNALLHSLLMAHEWRLELQPIHIMHTTAWLESSTSRVGTTKRIATHTAETVKNIPTDTTVYPTMAIIRAQTQRFDHLMEIVGSAEDPVGKRVHSKRNIKAGTQLGLYTGQIRDRNYGKHDIHLNHQDRDGTRYIDGTPPHSNSTAHMLSMMNEYIWLENDLDREPSRNSVTMDDKVPTALFANRFIPATAEMTVYYGEDYCWRHVKWHLIENILSVITGDILLSYEGLGYIVPEWCMLLTKILNPHLRTRPLSEQAYELYQSLPRVQPNQEPNELHLLKLLVDIIDNVQFEFNPSTSRALPPDQFNNVTDWLHQLAGFPAFRWATVFRRALSPHHIPEYPTWRDFILAQAAQGIHRHPRAAHTTNSMSDQVTLFFERSHGITLHTKVQRKRVILSAARQPSSLVQEPGSRPAGFFVAGARRAATLFPTHYDVIRPLTRLPEAGVVKSWLYTYGLFTGVKG